MRTLIRLVACGIISSVACMPAYAVVVTRDTAVARGRHIADTVCWACHVVAENQEFSPLLRLPTPAFVEIANRPGTSISTLLKYITATHWEKGAAARQMPDPQLTREEATWVSRYILSLRRKQASPSAANIRAPCAWTNSTLTCRPS